MRGEGLDTDPAAAAVRRPWLLVAVLAVALALVLAIVLQPHRTTPNPSTAPTPPVTSPSVGPTPSELSPSSNANRWEWASADLLPTGTGWRLLGLTDTGLVTIDPARHRIGRTIFAEFGGSDSGMGSIVPTPDGVVVQNGYRSDAYLVADDLSLTRLPTDGTARWLPGPDDGWPLWRLSDGDPLTVDTVDQRGRVRHRPVPDGSDSYTALGDGHGDLLLRAADGSTFRLTERGLARVTDAPIVAVGPTLLLTIRCSGEGSCWYETVDRTATQPRRVPGTVVADVTGGVISPDGRTAALTVSNGTAYALELVDLSTGRLRPAGTLPDYVGSLAWMPDSRTVVASLASTNAVYVADARTARGQVNTLPFPISIRQLVVDPYPRHGWD